MIPCKMIWINIPEKTYFASKYEIIPGADVFVQIDGRDMRGHGDSP